MPFNDQYVAYGEETTWGTAATPNKFSRIKAGGRVVPVIRREPYMTLGRITQDRMIDRVESGEASLVFPFVYEGIEKLLKHAFGEVATSGAGPYTHTFKVASYPPTGGTVTAKGMTLSANYELPDSSLEARRLIGGLVSSAELAFNVGEDVDIATEWVGKRVEQVAKTGTPSYPDLETYLVTTNQIAVTVDGNAYADLVRGVTLNIGFNRNVGAAFGSKYTERPWRSDRLSITGSLRMLWDTSPFTTKAIWDKLLSGASIAIVVTCTGPSSRTATLTIPKAVLLTDNLEMNEGERSPIEFGFECIDDATNSPAKLVVVNQTVTV